MDADEIFVSYSSKRRRAAKHLAEVLRLHGYTVWFDYHLIKGKDFNFQLDAKLTQAKAVVVLWCTSSVESLWVSREATRAEQLGTLVPVLAEACQLKTAHINNDAVDLRNWNGDPGGIELDKLFTALEAKIGRPPKPHANLRRYREQWDLGRLRFSTFPVDAADETEAAREGGVPTPEPEAAWPPPEAALPRALRPGFEMVTVPPNGRQVALSPLVTADEWGAFRNVHAGVSSGRVSDRTGHPILDVDWDSAQAYVRWATQRDNLDYRLPDDDSWEAWARFVNPSEAITLEWIDHTRNSLPRDPLGAGYAVVRGGVAPQRLVRTRHDAFSRATTHRGIGFRLAYDL